ncbi:protease [Pseudoalteromonas phenolica]|uniref:Putative beta-barrel assembly-enhancing protease n=1 Tax=Pseudoalteromonas phenolica TaxID=161398 RepID=A0A5S3YPB9_9GAMM|nr:M48 family metalloprotease [Pseudoalteromonas phenolica]TMP77983.1 protease [Pseudoalteromonas phenolica]
MFKRFLLGGLLSSTVFLSSFAQAQTDFKLPDLGSSALEVLPIDKEKALGKVMMMQIRGGSPLVQDPVLDEYITSLGNKLVANANDVRFPFTFFLINNQAINAFAFYGGHVGIHTGLIAQSDNESQLASVIGHEIAHVTQRHLARRLQHQKDNSALTVAGIVTGILAAVIAPDAGMAILSASTTQAGISQLSHSRKAEQEADRFGMQTLYKAGFDPSQAGEFLSKLANQVRFQTKPPTFLLTHPLPDTRVSDVRLRAQQYSAKQIQESLKFKLAKSRIIARYQLDSKDAQALFENELKKSSELNKAYLHYGLAISLLDQKKIQQAEKLLYPLLKDDPNNLFYLDVYTDILIAKGEAKKAVEYLTHHNELRPNNQVLALNYANAAIKAKKYAKAEQTLKLFLLSEQNHLLAKELLTEVYKGSDNKSAYYEAKADVLAEYGAFLKAADEIQRALNHVKASETVKKTRLKALLKQYRQMQKEIAKL